MSIMISNLEDKSNGEYYDLSLGGTLLLPDVLSLADFVEEILAKREYVAPLKKESYLNRIDIRFDSGILSRWNLPFDEFAITLYRDGWEVESKDFTSNYMYMENDEGHRTFWVDLYYTPEDYDSDDVFRDIIMEINNFIHRDFDEYLNNLNDEEI